MPLRVYRVCRTIHARLDGLGSRRVGGRWNSPGRAVVYMAQCVALAVLENLVHMSRLDFPTGYVVVAADIPNNLEIVTEERVRYAAGLARADPRTIGDYWIDNRLSAALRVPSSVVLGESNYLLNPQHPDFRMIITVRPTAFEFDP